VAALYQLTQKDLLEKVGAGQTAKLYRGIGTSEYVAGNMESWTEDPAVARRFAGLRGIVVEADIPIERILAYYAGPVWQDITLHRGEREYLILAEKPR
jgi:hypothetical protein